MDREQLEREVFTGLLKLAKASIEAFRKYNEAQKSGAKEEELKKLEDAKVSSRATFNDEYKKVIGEDRQKGKMWACFCQKANIFGMIGPQIYMYATPYEMAEQFRHTAKAYIEGHKVLGWGIRSSINPRSIQNLDKGLAIAEQKAVDACDVSLKEEIMRIRGNIKRHAGALLSIKIEKQKETALTLGEKLGSENVKVLQEAVKPAPPEQKQTARHARKTKKENE